MPEVSLGWLLGSLGSWSSASLAAPELMSQLLCGEPGPASQVVFQCWFGRFVHITSVKKSCLCGENTAFLALTQLGFTYSG